MLRSVPSSELRHIKIFFSSARYHALGCEALPSTNFVLKPSPRDLVKVGSKWGPTLSLPVTDHRSPPWGKVGGHATRHASLRVCTRSERRQSGWSVHVWSVLTHTGVAATMTPCPAPCAAHGRRTPRACGVPTTHTATHGASARCVLPYGSAPSPPPALVAHRPPPLSLSAHLRLESVLPTTLNAHQPAGCATHVTVATARVPSHPLQLSTACACRYVQ